MTEVVEFLRPRGEYVSLLAVAVLLVLAVRPVARLVGLPRQRVGDLFWNAALAFVVVGRLAFVALEAPSALLDPLVLIRIQGGIEPLAGAGGAALAVAWQARRDEAARRWRWVLAAAGGLALATAGYDLACVLRDACYGAVAPPPLGFRMSGLAETRLPAPLIEAAALLLVLAAVVAALERLPASTLALGLLGALATLRAVLTPASVRGWDAVGVESALLLAAGLALLVAAAVLARRARGGREAGPALANDPEAART